MKINTKWEQGMNRTLHLVCNGITLARTWPIATDWQIAVNLPGAKVDGHLKNSLTAAKKQCETSVTHWFDRIDA